ncbi:hypothetical protein JVT61DRAFT_3288 [Boletus reticuloceps]|uniref:F-box domain-containing protein n=1 Tax=Boletus reticuloceps TaxID=495285 RepID=A0A8I3A8C8_9AGAM|nr:hypothetical protein JVT61DRAFT_3288 [Boletus reticuloceps]
MHHCLLIPELAISIIQFLADDRPAWHDSRYLKNPRDVARLAQTCKALAEPALDTLWKTQHSLAPLVMCLPPDVWELTRRGKTFALKREPTPMEWSSLKKYAHRIWFISQPASFNLPRLDDVVLASLISPSHFGALFPSLRILDYSVVSVAAPMIHLLTKVLSTERHLGLMTSLCVICPRASQKEQVYDLFQAIRTKATQLETLRIDSFTSTASNSTLAVTLVEGEFKFLRKLELSWTIHISTECLTCLVGMERLQEISLCVRRDIGLDFLANGCSFTKTKGPTSPTCKRTLPVLKSLKVMAHSLDQCTALVSLVTSPFLDNITFSYDVQAPSALIEAFFRQIYETCQNAVTISTLSHTISLTLKHNLGPLSSATSPFLIHPSQTLSPLLTLRHLRSLRLLHLGTIAVDDGFLREAANAWGAHLQELEECGIPWVGVEESSDLPGYVAATLDGVGEFMRRCPRLERLRVAFDGRGSPEERPGDTQRKQEMMQEEEVCNCDPSRESEQLAFSSSVLQVLNVRDSPIDDPERVAKFLKRVAPALRVICVEGSLDMWRKWREVEDRMK